MFDRLRFVIRVACVLCMAFATAVCSLDATRPEFVLLITVDTLRADHLGSYGDARAQTPHLDGLATRGVRFENATTVSNNTLPAHASVLTGRYPRSVGILRNSFPLPADEVTLAQHFRREGFQTAAFISASVLGSRMGLDRGFDEYDEDLDVAELDQQQRRAEQTTDAFLQWMSERRSGPAFVWLHYFDPHYPYSPPAPCDSLFGSEYVELANGSMEYLAGLWAKRGRRAKASPADLQRVVDLYDGEIAYLDVQLGRVFESIEAAGLAERSLVAVTADHGESLVEHDYLFDHGLHLYQPSLGVPLILRLPAALGIEASTATAQVQSLDLFPTLLEASGIEVPTEIEGRSLLPLLRGETTSVRRYSFSESCRPWNAERAGSGEYRNHRKAQVVVDGPWKFISTPHAGKRELYHTVDDPQELRNRIAEDFSVTSRL